MKGRLEIFARDEKMQIMEKNIAQSMHVVIK